MCWRYILTSCLEIITQWYLALRVLQVSGHWELTLSIHILFKECTIKITCLLPAPAKLWCHKLPNLTLNCLVSLYWNVNSKKLFIVFWGRAIPIILFMLTNSKQLICPFFGYLPSRKWGWRKFPVLHTTEHHQWRSTDCFDDIFEYCSIF